MLQPATTGFPHDVHTNTFHLNARLRSPASELNAWTLSKFGDATLQWGQRGRGSTFDVTSVFTDQ